MIDQLHSLLNKSQRYDINNFETIPEFAGLDIAFEKGQLYNGTDGTVTDRIVRIGFSGNLQQRIAFHFEGINGQSVFRQNIATALGKEDEDAPVSDYMRDNISFAIVPNAGPLKARFIATLFQNPDFKHSDPWLGAQAGLDKLWQTNNLNGAPLNQQMFDQLCRYIADAASPKEKSKNVKRKFKRKSK